ncbi:MAG TPA: MgtC/SapB family protein, partial [Chloroflexota bacterium]|nr:MgtC/SapB family protein [Chloroflexota bacterium]
MIESWNDLLNILPDSGLKIGVAIACGFLLGIERERRNKPAGLRTIMLITVGATLFMIVSNLIPFITDWPRAIARVDPSRIASEVVTGIGFLGAGAIIQARGAVHGLTTAAVIWVAAGIGLCVGIGYPVLAVALTLVVVVVLSALDPLERWLSRRGQRQRIELIAPNDSLSVHRIKQVLEQHGVRQDEMDVRPRSRDEVYVSITYHASSSTSTSQLLELLSRMEGVRGRPHFG